MIILPGSCTMLFHTQTGEKVPDESYALAQFFLMHLKEIPSSISTPTRALARTLGSVYPSLVKSKNGAFRFARPAAAVAARLRSTASAASRCCPTYPSWHPPGISSLPVRRLRMFGPGVAMLKAADDAIMFDGNGRWAAAPAGYRPRCPRAERLFLPPRAARSNRRCRPSSSFSLFVR